MTSSRIADRLARFSSSPAKAATWQARRFSGVIPVRARLPPGTIVPRVGCGHRRAQRMLAASRRRATMTSGRLEALTDGVIAIIITIMVL
ncbi:MAG TPA: hypothetical protein VGP86_00915, partial [Xanthobacteraceae bacterium]|nr:hypothetical protein [Xanthobacteraceae bacterium]